MRKQMQPGQESLDSFRTNLQRPSNSVGHHAALRGFSPLPHTQGRSRAGKEGSEGHRNVRNVAKSFNSRAQAMPPSQTLVQHTPTRAGKKVTLNPCGAFWLPSLCRLKHCAVLLTSSCTLKVWHIHPVGRLKQQQWQKNYVLKQKERTKAPREMPVWRNILCATH